MYEKSYLDDKMQFGFDTQKGESFLGDIVTRKVAAYSIEAEGDKPARTVNTFTTVVLGDTEGGDWESKVKAAFRNRGHELDNSASIANFSIASKESLAAFEAEKSPEIKEKVA